MGVRRFGFRQGSRKGALCVWEDKVRFHVKHEV